MNSKDTWRPLGAAHHVDTGGNDVGGLAAAGQVFGESHLVEVEGRVQTALVHLQLVTQSVDVVLRWRDTQIQTSTSVHGNTATIFIKTCASIQHLICFRRECKMEEHVSSHTSPTSQNKKL